MNRAAWRGVIASALVATLSLTSTRASADEAPAAAVDRSVEVILLGSGRDTGALVDTVRELLGRLRLVANVHAVSTDDDAAKIDRGTSVARVVVDLRPTSETIVVVSGREGGPSRRLVRRDASPSVAREELAHAIQGAVEAQLLVDGDRPPEPPPVPKWDDPRKEPTDWGPLVIVVPPAPAPKERPVAPAPTRSFGLDLMPLSGVGGFSNQAPPVVHIGGTISLASRKPFGPFGGVEVRGLIPFESEENAVVAHTSDWAIRGYAGLELLHFSWLSLSAFLGGGIDVLNVAPRSATLPPNVLAHGTTRVDPILAFGARAHFPIVPSVALSITLLGDVDFAARRYVVQRGSTEETMLEPWRFRPAILAGFTFTAFGAGIFSRGGG